MPNTTDRRVLRLITRLNIGGPARQALLLTRELSDEFPTLLAAGRPDTHEGEMSDLTVPITRVPLTRPVAPTRDLASVVAVRRLLGTWQPAIVHTHMAKAGTVGRIAVLSGHDRPKTVHTFHGHVLDGYFGRAATRAALEVEKFLAQRTDVLIAVSPEVRDDLLERGIGSSGSFEVIPLGLDLHEFLAVSALDPSGRRGTEESAGSLRHRLGIQTSAVLCAMVGRLTPIKNGAAAIDAIASVESVHLAMIGDGELRHELETMVNTRGINDRVHFTGWSDDLVKDLSDIDMSILTSRNEGTPVALIEAAAAARPVVAVDVGGVRQVVEHDVTGLLVSAGDIRGLSESIRRLAVDPLTRHRMGMAGRERVRNCFGARRLVEDIRTLYTSLAGW